MIPAVSTSALSSRYPSVALKRSAYIAAIVAKMRAVAPYALIELIFPGGSVMALLLWLYRRHKKAPVSATQDILALL